MGCEREKDEWGVCDDPSCFPCKLKSIQISPYATPTRRSNRGPSTPPRGNSNSWEKGIPTDSRGMPVLKSDGSPMGQAEYASKRSQIEESRRRLRNAPANPN